MRRPGPPSAATWARRGRRRDGGRGGRPPRAVLLAGGGTAGHVEPALALADALGARWPGVRVVLLGTAAGLEMRLVPARGYELALVPKVALPRRAGLDLLAVPVRLLAATRRAGEVIERTGAEVVVGFGGYVALPAYLAARLRGLPIVVHEANARPGLANRVGALLTGYVAVAHPGTPLRARGRPAQVTGIPLRAGIAGLDRRAARAQARRRLGVAPQAPCLLVFGGSQGARRLNAAVACAAAELSAAGVEVVHVAGPAQVEGVLAALGGRPPAGYHLLGYLDDMAAGYAAADLALCRAGALTCAELAAVGLPAVYVPLPVGNGEQRANAAPTVAAGGGLLLEDSELTAEAVRTVVLPLLGDPERLGAMASAARSSGVADPAGALLDVVARACGTIPA